MEKAQQKLDFFDSLGRGLDPADQVTKPIRLDKWYQMLFI